MSGFAVIPVWFVFYWNIAAITYRILEISSSVIGDHGIMHALSCIFFGGLMGISGYRCCCFPCVSEWQLFSIQSLHSVKKIFFGDICHYHLVQMPLWTQISIAALIMHQVYTCTSWGMRSHLFSVNLYITPWHASSGSLHHIFFPMSVSHYFPLFKQFLYIFKLNSSFSG